MATKPSDLPRWATDLTNNTAPTSGQQDTGWTPNQVAVSSYFNWLAELVYRWTSYLDDGAFTGLYTFNDGLRVPAGQTLDAEGIVDFKDVTAYLAPSELHKLDLSSGLQSTATASFDGVKWTINSTGTVDFPVPIIPGYRVTQVSVVVKRVSGTITASLQTRDNDPTSAGLTLRCSKDLSSGTNYNGIDLATSPSVGSLPYTDQGGDNGMFVRVAGDCDLAMVHVTMGRIV